MLFNKANCYFCTRSESSPCSNQLASCCKRPTILEPLTTTRAPSSAISFPEHRPSFSSNASTIKDPNLVKKVFLERTKPHNEEIRIRYRLSFVSFLKFLREEIKSLNVGNCKLTRDRTGLALVSVN